MTSSYRPEIIQGAFIDFIGSRLYPFWSLTVPKLRLISRRALSDELIALQFEVNRAFKQRAFDSSGGWHGGQYIDLIIPLEGINHQRSYSLVGLPKQALWWHDDTSDYENNRARKNQQRYTLTIAIKPQGLVSNYLTKHANIGTIFAGSLPSGEFTLQQTALSSQARLSTNQQPATAKLSFDERTPLLFIAGGSGITPMLGLIAQALNDKRQVTLVHYNRGLVLESYWQQLKIAHPSFNYYLINTQNPETYLADTRYLQASSLLVLDLPLMQTQIFACGSQALIASLYRAADDISLESGASNKHHSDDKYSLRDNIIIERFGTALPDLTLDAIDKLGDTDTHTVYLRSRQQQFSSDSTLLMSAEQAGIRLNYGCRQGICQLCRCDKVSGVVKNIQTGTVSRDGYESIQTCINIAMTDVVLDV